MELGTDLCHVFGSLVPLCLHTKDNVLEGQTATETGENLISNQFWV